MLNRTLPRPFSVIEIGSAQFQRWISSQSNGASSRHVILREYSIRRPSRLLAGSCLPCHQHQIMEDLSLTPGVLWREPDLFSMSCRSDGRSATSRAPTVFSSSSQEITVGILLNLKGRQCSGRYQYGTGRKHVVSPCNHRRTRRLPGRSRRIKTPAKFVRIENI